MTKFISAVYRESLRSHSQQRETRELLLHRALGWEVEPHSLRAWKKRRALLWHVDVSAGKESRRHYDAQKCWL